MPSPVPSSCSNRSENSAQRLAIERRRGIGAGGERRHVTRRTTDLGEDQLAGPDLVGDGTAGRRRQELHERLEVVDRALASPRVDEVFRILEAIALAQALHGDAAARFVGEYIVGDTHLIRIGVAGKGQQGGDLRLPAEPADAPLAGGLVDDHRGTAADAVAIAIERILERQQRLRRARPRRALRQTTESARAGRRRSLREGSPPGSDDPAAKTSGTASCRQRHERRRSRRGSRRAARSSGCRRRSPARYDTRRSRCR